MQFDKELLQLASYIFLTDLITLLTDGPQRPKVQIDGWETGGRAPAKTKEELRVS